MSGNSRVIFSFYKEVNDDSVTSYKKEQLKLYKDKLIKRQHLYAKSCNADYFVYENSNLLLNEYDSIQFRKIEKLEELTNEYDEVLYLDLDIIPFDFKNFFKEHDLSKICCHEIDGKEWGINRYKINVPKMNNAYNNSIWEEENNKQSRYLYEEVDSMNMWLKASSKNAMLLLENHTSYNHNIINTGVIGGNKDSIKQLKFTENLQYMIDLIDKAKYDNIYSKKVQELIKPNNEVFFSYLIEKNNIPITNINKNWNFIVDDYTTGLTNVWKEISFLHVINKDFEGYGNRYNLF
jgi:hypothetical protein